MMMRAVVFLALAVSVAAPAAAGSADDQLGGLGKIGSAVKKANDVRELQVIEEEEQALGAAVSERIRARYGVMQDAAVHR